MIVFSDNFDAGQAAFNASWTNAGVALAAGGCSADGFMIGCTAGTAFHAFSTGAEIACRAQVAAKFLDAGWSQHFAFLSFPGLDGGCSFVYILDLRGDGSFSFRMNNVASVLASAAGLFPTNGIIFALQWRIEILSPFTALFAVDVNNSTVWTDTIDWSGLAGGCPSGGQSVFTGITLFPINDLAHLQTVTDNLEIDDSNAMVDWPACTPTPGPCGIPVDCVVPTITVHPPPTITILGQGVRPETGGSLTRDATFLDPAQSWTHAFWAELFPPLPVPGHQRVLLDWEDNLNGDPYVYLATIGDNFNNALNLQISDNASAGVAAEIGTPALGTWVYVGLTYNAATGAFVASLNAVSVLAATLDFSAVVPITLETVFDSAFSGAVSDPSLGSRRRRVWQASLSLAELAAEMASASAVRTANLLADTPLPSASDLTDHSGHGHGWTAVPVIDSGESVILTVAATGDGLTYQWYEGESGDTSTPVVGATDPTFVTPPLTVTTRYWVRITNTCGSVDSATIIIVSAATLALACPAVTTAPLLTAYAESLVATGGSSPYTYAIISGALPPGLTLDAETGAITGIPTLVGTYPFTAQVTDAIVAIATANCTIVVTGAAPIPRGYQVVETTIRRVRRAPHLSNEQKRIFYPAIEVDLSRGIGNVVGQGVEPQVMLRISRDGGETWGPETWMSAGKIGEYRKRVIARNLGYGRDVVFEVIVSDPNNWNLIGAFFDPPPIIGKF